MTADLASLPLSRIYQHLLDGSASTSAVVDVLTARAALSAEIFRGRVLDLSQMEIDDQLARTAGIQEDTTDESPKMLAARERARIQFSVLESESARRMQRARDLNTGAASAPSRAALYGAVNELEESLRATLPHRLASAFAALTDRMRAAIVQQPAGTPQVVHALNAVADILVAAPDATSADTWTLSYAALLLFVEEDGFAGVRVPARPATKAQALAAARILRAQYRADPRRIDPSAPLDTTPAEVADALHAAHQATARWVDLSFPADDLALAIAPCTAEELGRPTPTAWIRPVSEAQHRATLGGAVLNPALLETDPATFVADAESTWMDGLQPRRFQASFDDALGLRLTLGPDLSWIRPIDRRGLLCAVALAPHQILRCGGDAGREGDRILREAQDTARHRARTSKVGINVALRALLIEKGYRALLRAGGTETSDLVIFDPSPSVLTVIRESVPSFVQKPTVLPRSRSQPTTPARLQR